MMMKFSTLERKARAAVNNSPQGRQLDREKLAVDKGLAAGKYSKPQAAVLKRSLRVLRRIDQVQELYALMRAKSEGGVR